MWKNLGNPECDGVVSAQVAPPELSEGPWVGSGRRRKGGTHSGQRLRIWGCLSQQCSKYTLDREGGEETGFFVY